MSTTRLSGPRVHLHLNGFALLAVAVLGNSWTGLNWWIFAALFAIGFSRGIDGAPLTVGTRIWLGVRAVWAAHIGMDRLIGYGNKTGFGDIFIGRARCPHADAEQVRTSIVKATIGLIRDDGIAGLTVRAVVDRAGSSVGNYSSASDGAIVSAAARLAALITSGIHVVLEDLSLSRVLFIGTPGSQTRPGLSGIARFSLTGCDQMMLERILTIKDSDRAGALLHFGSRRSIFPLIPEVSDPPFRSQNPRLLQEPVPSGSSLLNRERCPGKSDRRFHHLKRA